jgi:hypothetical protein
LADGGTRGDFIALDVSNGANAGSLLITQSAEIDRAKLPEPTGLALLAVGLPAISRAATVGLGKSPSRDLRTENPRGLHLRLRNSRIVGRDDVHAGVQRFVGDAYAACPWTLGIAARPGCL